jgi:UrcA family protein
MKTINYTKQIAMASVAAICVASATMGAHADEAAVNAPTRTVHYSDLNLNTPTGVSVLYRRIRSAAEQVCGDVNSRRLEEAAAAKACVSKAVYVSVHSVNNVRLTNEYNAHVGVAKESINFASVR